MKVSIFEDNIIYGVDYTSRPDCLEVIDITNQDFQAIKAGTHKLEKVDGQYILVDVPQPELEIDEETVIGIDEEIDEMIEEEQE